MTINEEVIKVMREFDINPHDGLCYLISLYHGYRPTYIPEKLKQKMNATNIVISERDKTLRWNIPLYDGQVTGWDWVTNEYVKLFKDSNPQKGGYAREAIARMKEFFAEHPDVRKDEVMGATTMYVRSTHPTYLRLPHYFIKKGRGVEKTEDLITWVEKYREENAHQIRTSKSNTMQ